MKEMNLGKAATRFAATLAAACLAVSLVPGAAIADTGDDSADVAVASVTLNGDSYEWSTTLNGAAISGTATKVTRNADGTIEPVSVTVTESSKDEVLAAGTYTASFDFVKAEGTDTNRVGVRSFTLTAANAETPALSGTVYANADGEDAYTNVVLAGVKDASGETVPTGDLEASLTPVTVNADGTETKGATVTVAANVVSEANVDSTYRVYNALSGEHIYTTSYDEVKNLLATDANVYSYEGVAWIAPHDTTLKGVHRLYNPFGEHFYTADATEIANDTAAGWQDEGVVFYSYAEAAEGETQQGVPVYRAYNRMAPLNNHLFTTVSEEVNNVVAAGWTSEGNAFYEVK